MRLRSSFLAIAPAFLCTSLARAEPSLPSLPDTMGAASAQVGTQAATPPKAPPPSPTLKVDPNNRTGLSPYMSKLLKGNAAFVVRDFTGAKSAYREAIDDNPKEPLGFYLLAEAQIATGSLPEAEASLLSGVAARGVVGQQDQVHAKLLFCLADLYERQARFADGKKRWEEYVQFAAAHSEAKASGVSGSERIKVIDNHVDLETKSAAVKQRIEARLRETSSDPEKKR